MTCTGCQAKVKTILSGIRGVRNVTVDLKNGEAQIDMTRYIPLPELKSAFKNHPTYELSENVNDVIQDKNLESEKTWFQTYLPILLIFTYILGVTLLVQTGNETFNWSAWMNHFMAGFFLVFSFFKLLNIRGFATSYSMYDIIARKWHAWGYIYPFIELFLGIAFLIAFNPLLTNLVTFTVMSISLIGVLQNAFTKTKIKCACLGDFFNLPVSTITVIEDSLMIGMSLIILTGFIF
jgi:copper chaperone CopZ